MIVSKKSEWIIFSKPFGENIDWQEPEYHIQRSVDSKGNIIWYGINTNWVKEYGKNWTKLKKSEFVECDIPIYEQKYIEKFGYMGYSIGDEVRHSSDNAPFIITALGTEWVEIQGDWSGGTHCVNDIGKVKYNEIEHFIK